MTSDWISVKDQLPPDSSTVMICLLGIVVWVGHYNHGKKEWRMGNEMRSRKDGIVAVTHWMLKPEPPK